MSPSLRVTTRIVILGLVALTVALVLELRRDRPSPQGASTFFASELEEFADILSHLQTSNDIAAVKGRLAALDRTLKRGSTTSVNAQFDRLRDDYLRLCNSGLESHLMDCKVIAWIHSIHEELAQADIEKIVRRIKIYRSAYGVFPDVIDDLTKTTPSGIRYLHERELMDPWGNKYEYYSPDSVGPDERNWVVSRHYKSKNLEAARNPQ